MAIAAAAKRLSTPLRLLGTVAVARIRVIFQVPSLNRQREMNLPYSAFVPRGWKR
jgi:hypothetical protein